MIQLELQPEFEAKLAAEAQSHGLPLSRYVEGLLDSAHQEDAELQERLASARPRQKETPAEAVAAIRQLRQGLSLGGLMVKDLVNEGRKY